MKKITLCSSATFYENIFPIKEELEKLGFEVLLPASAEEMRATGDFNVEKTKTWLINPADFHQKTSYMRRHLKKIDEGDAVLVVNLEKGGMPGYIGGNVLLELFYGWIKKKPLYILHPLSKDLPLYEEIMGMNPLFLGNDLLGIETSL